MPDYLYIDAIKKKPVPRTPIWIMRQAGRYLPEYQAVRQKHDFLTVCKTPELAAQVTLQPIERFGFDAAILFSDILVIPEAMGQKLDFLENHGPKLSPQVLDEKVLASFSLEGLEEKLHYVAQAIQAINAELGERIPLIGFSGSPFTLATYMIEGKPTRNFKYIKGLLYQKPDFVTHILDMLCEAVIRYLKMQITAGVNAIQIFDTWGGILPPHLYRNYSAEYLTKIARALKNSAVPITLFSKAGLGALQILKDSDADVLSVDWMTDIAQAKNAVGDTKALQGNLDPTVLYGNRETITMETERILHAFGNESGHIFNLGHGILPDIPVDNVAWLVDQVREISSKLHS